MYIDVYRIYSILTLKRAGLILTVMKIKMRSDDWQLITLNLQEEPAGPAARVDMRLFCSAAQRPEAAGDATCLSSACKDPERRAGSSPLITASTPSVLASSCSAFISTSHLHGAFKRVITAVIQSNYEPSQHTESVSLMFRKIYIRMTSSCSDVMLRSGAPHQALFLELGRLSSNFCVWKQHGRHREVAAQSVSASPASEWNDSTTGRHKVSNHVSASTQQLVDWNVPTLRLDGGFRLSQQHTNAPWTFCGSRWNCMQSD